MAQNNSQIKSFYDIKNDVFEIHQDMKEADLTPMIHFLKNLIEQDSNLVIEFSGLYEFDPTFTKRHAYLVFYAFSYFWFFDNFCLSDPAVLAPLF